MGEREPSSDAAPGVVRAGEPPARLARLYALSSRVSGAMLRARSAEELAATACRLVVEEHLAALAWVGLVDAAGHVVPIARHGRDAGYVDMVRLELDGGPAAGGPATKALRTGRVSVSDDVEADPDFFWRAEAVHRGLRSCAVLPLAGGRTEGIFALYADTPHAFGDEEIVVLEGLADNLRFAMEASRTAAERDRLLADMTERVKELTLLHRVARQLSTDGPTDQALLDELVSYFPSAWQSPDRCRARITWNGLLAENPGFRVTEHRLVERLSAGGREGAIEVVYLDDPPGPILPFLDEERELLRSLADLLDVHLARRRADEDRRRAEDHLRRAQKMDALGRLAAGIAHDLNNLLGVILSNASLLEEDAAPGGPEADNAREIGEASERAAELVRQLLAFSRQQPVEPRVVDLRRVVAGFGRILRRTAGPAVTLDLDVEGEPTWVLVDPAQIEQVVLNLVVNARDAAQGGGAITVTVGEEPHRAEDDADPATPGPRPARWAALRVSDTGEGIDEATRERIFEPFFTTKELGRGTGLGLSIVYGIVRQAGGHIRVESTPGAGTTMIVCLPRVPAPDVVH